MALNDFNVVARDEVGVLGVFASWGRCAWFISIANLPSSSRARILRDCEGTSVAQSNARGTVESNISINYM